MPQCDILRRFHLTSNGYFLFMGRLVKEKNPDVLIEAFIKAGIKDKKLVIAGDNASLPDYTAHLREISAKNEDVVFTGAVYDKDKEDLLKNCFVFCIPSTIEGLSITLLEAMSYARPVLASDILSNREALGDSGIYVIPEDTGDLSSKLVFCIDNPGELEPQKKANRQRVQDNFTWEIIVRKYLAYIKQLMF